jgi:sec-independent protein translocase protein TatA
MSLGIWQILIILLVVLIVFGAGRLPNVMGDLGRGIRNFKAGLGGDAPPEKPSLPPSDDDDKIV